DFILPDAQIAKYPLNERDQSKLLIYQEGVISRNQFNQLDKILSAGSLLVFNNTRVIPARIQFVKNTGAHIEIFCLEPVIPNEYQLAFQSYSCTWKCMVGNLKKWHDEILEKELIWQ